MIGEIRKTITPFWDVKCNKMSYKSRPALIIAKADTDDYVVLPVSRITKKNNLDVKYDVEVDPAIYPMSNLTNISYVRTHKQTIINASQIADCIGDIKGNYEELYLSILEKREEFSTDITDQALSNECTAW